MPIKRIKDFPEGSGTLTTDDILLFMDNPAGSGITKKISFSEIIANVSDTKIIYYSGVFPSTIHNLDTQDADIIMFDLDDNTNIPSTSGYLSITGMKAGRDGQKITLFNVSDYEATNTATVKSKRILLFNEVLGSGSEPQNRFASKKMASTAWGTLLASNKAIILGNGFGATSDTAECIYSSYLSRWMIFPQVTVSTSQDIYLTQNSAGSVGGGGV